ncbi:cytochrome c biogenesis CcdA family protein [Evansella sp. LMS18]|uniref:cytochrome c biogenesis CcdA family protein n=1 Tax=Evansella sp. LMS18 TaxID=2924033 RepID=UPI0020D08563|nr:cytochrome c biogenesis CcdA family protein [Evansella sp. LMS18]UTR11190.1 cytochrome c biogenesis CcdA family protein [Evansella sp. LMS18]
MDILFAFAAGVLSFTSACILPLIPSYIAVITGLTVTELKSTEKLERFKILPRSAAFVIGLIIPLIIIGMGATTIGGFFTPAFSDFLSQLLGFIVIIFGLHLLGLLNIRFLQREIRFNKVFQRKGGLFTTGLMGMAFGFGWTPCIGPMLSSILILAADSETVWQGGGLLLVYGAGLGLPFILIGFASASSLKLLRFLQKHVKILSTISGILLLLLGILLITGNMAYITPGI